MTRGIHWFRNDLRLQDNTALNEIARRADEWLPVFIVDPRISNDLEGSSRRNHFLFDCLERLGAELAKKNIPLLIRHGHPESVLPKLVEQTGASLLTFNIDITPFARHRDDIVEQKIRQAGATVIARQDHVMYAPSEVRTKTGGAYSVYTPYRRTWMRKWEDEPRLPVPCGRLKPAIPGFARDSVPKIRTNTSQVTRHSLPTGGEAAAHRRLDSFLSRSVVNYHIDRDRPDIDGTSRLSPYLRFGAVSVRQCFARAMAAAHAESPLEQGVGKWLDELVWREFYSGVLEENPRVLRESYRHDTKNISWNDNPSDFEAWCRGETGYPIVDAGMRQLRSTGWMHNRVRMIVASFLTKDLLIDWRKGERFFFKSLVDGDPASNNGGWQWASSTGTDAQPYFRIFNPTTQGKRWDPDGSYVRKWIPELEHVPTKSIHSPSEKEPIASYPAPIVDHSKRRKIAIERFKMARESKTLHD